MATMKEVCDQVGVSYETLRFYCNEGLVPNIKRDKNNYRIFDEIHDSIEFIDGKQKFFDSVLAGETEYISNLIYTDE